MSLKHQLTCHRTWRNSTNLVAAKQEPQWLELTDVHRCGLEAKAQMSGDFPAYAVHGLLVTAKQQYRFSKN